MVDPVKLSMELMRCKSVTPADDGAIDLIDNELQKLGFNTSQFTFTDDSTDPVKNLYAKIGNKSPNFCFAGHSDVVPPGDVSLWSHDPFDPIIKNGVLYGRGAVDMKPAIACFIAATARLLENHNSTDIPGSISLLITGDEEDIAINGTKKLLEAIYQDGEKIDYCLVGEPTNPEAIGEMVKIGRRGSVSFSLTLGGIQGHVAYPKIAANPTTPMIQILHELSSKVIDLGNKFFDASNLEVTTIDAENKADNVIPQNIKAKFNIRFNNEQNSNDLIKWVDSVCNSVCNNSKFTYDLKTRVSGEAFITEPGKLSEIVSKSVSVVTGATPLLSTTGGTSDARFIKDYCPVVEFGLINKSAHKIDENVSVKAIEDLTEIYYQILLSFFRKNK